jgi:hypothetical protein
MDWAKLDPGLGRKVTSGAEGEVEVRVFVRTRRPPTREEATLAGVDVSKSKRRIFTQTISLRDVDRLSEAPWVESVSLGETLHPRG